MFLVHKYHNELNNMMYHKNIINKIININDLDYNNIQHLIIYGPNENKELIINKLLEKIFDKKSIEIHDVEYNINGYSNIKTKIYIKQSKYHIIIEPNFNGFDKYLIQEIIQNYAKSESLNIIKNIKNFKFVIINKIDNLSYYAQASLRRTMEKYSNTCKFILISDQLSKIIEPIRSRCLLIRVPLASYIDILEIILYIVKKENIHIDNKKLNNIIKSSNYNINYAIWLLEMFMYNIEDTNNWELLINNIVYLIYNYKKYNLYKLLKNIRNNFYILFITNISTQLIIRKIMIKLLLYINDFLLKYQIINTTSIYEQRINQGTRHIIHIEAYIIRLIYILHNNHNLNILEL
jgi:replication factor C subunit 3/5